MFPQGKRSVDTKAPAKRGVAELAHDESVRVIPVLILPKGSRFKLPRYVIVCGAPFDAQKLDADRIMHKVFSLKNETVA